MLIVFAETVT